MLRGNTRGGGRAMGSWFSDFVSNPMPAILAPVQAVQQLIPAPIAQAIAAPIQAAQAVVAQAPIIGQYVAPIVGAPAQLVSPTATIAAPGPAYYSPGMTQPVDQSTALVTSAIAPAAANAGVMPAGWQDEVRSLVTAIEPAGGVKPWMIGGGILALAGIGALIWHSQSMNQGAA